MNDLVFLLFIAGCRLKENDAGSLLPLPSTFTFSISCKGNVLLDPLQKHTELTVKPFEGGRFGRLVVGMAELLDGDLLEVRFDDLFGQGVVQYVVVDGHAEIAGDVERRMFIVIFDLEDFIQSVSEHIQRGERHTQGVLAFQNAPIHIADFAQRVGQGSL